MKIDEIRAQYPQYADVSDGELARGLHRTYYKDMQYADFLKRIDFGRPVDPTADMSGTDKFLAGAGKSFVDLGRGVRQIGSSDAPTMSGLVTGDKRSAMQQEVDEARQLDAPLMKTGAGLAGNIAGSAAMFAPTAFIPGANTYTGAALAGGALAALQPTATGESRGANTGLGALMGAGGQGVGNMIGRALRPVASRLSPEEQALATAAEREGIQLTAGQKTGSRPLQVTESVMENLPLTSGPQLAGREAQQRAFTAAALKRAGISGDAATPEALLAQKSKLGGELSAIAKGNTLDFNQTAGQDLTGRLGQIVSEASKRGKTASEPVASVVDNILAEVNQNGVMSGQNYQAWRQMLRPLAQSGGPDSHYYDQIRKALDTAFNEQIATTGGAGAWKGANREYANLKTIMQAAGGPGNAAASNQLSPAQLSVALRQAMGKEGIALGRGDLNELTRVGQKFVKDQIPNSGTAQRQMMQALLTGGGAGVGGGTAYAMGKDPLEGAAYGAGIGAGAMVTPRIAQMLMNSKAGQAYLSKGAVSLTDADRKALAAILRSSGAGMAPALAAQ